MSLEDSEDNHVERNRYYKEPRVNAARRLAMEVKIASRRGEPKVDSKRKDALSVLRFDVVM